MPNYYLLLFCQHYEYAGIRFYRLTVQSVHKTSHARAVQKDFEIGNVIRTFFNEYLWSPEQGSMMEVTETIYHFQGSCPVHYYVDLLMKK